MSRKTNTEDNKEKKRGAFPGYPKYPAEEDIYKQERETEFIEDDSVKSGPTRDESPAADLDIPGSELDDSNEEIGEEDEENNYYSLGNEDQEDSGTD